MLAPSLIPHDIILADIRAVLYLDDLERDAAGVFELVLRRLGDEDRLALVEHGPLLAARDLGRAAQDDPVLRAMVVHLQRDGLAGEDADCAIRPGHPPKNQPTIEPAFSLAAHTPIAESSPVKGAYRLAKKYLSCIQIRRLIPKIDATCSNNQSQRREKRTVKVSPRKIPPPAD